MQSRLRKLRLRKITAEFGMLFSRYVVRVDSSESAAEVDHADLAHAITPILSASTGCQSSYDVTSMGRCSHRAHARYADRSVERTEGESVKESLSPSFSVVEAVRKRRSVRTYDGRPLEAPDREAIMGLADTLGNPFGVPVRIHFAERGLNEDGEKLGTYGVIKGASSFLGVSVPDVELAALAAGYEFETLILHATSRGLGTVWLAATFSRESFAFAMDIPSDSLFPAISPIGYPAKPRMLESVMRSVARSSTRKGWEELFFEGSFGNPLSKEAAGDFSEPLELLRLAPSAVNAQPWRVVKDRDAFHFYAVHKPAASKDEAMIKRVDLGIAVCHFCLSVQERGIGGGFRSVSQPACEGVPANAHYVISWSPSFG